MGGNKRDVRIFRNDRDGAAFVAKNLREFDRHEIRTFRAADPEDVVLQAVRMATKFWVVYHRGVPCAVIGYCTTSIIGEEAVPFFVATPEVEAYRHKFARWSLILSQELADINLRNFTLASNKIVLRWLKWLKFNLSEIKQVDGHDVRFFTRLKDV